MSEPMKINNQELKFPVDWEFRVIVEAAKAAEARKAIEACLIRHNVISMLHDGVHSTGGRYRVFKAPVTLLSREMMNLLAADLGKIDGVKFLL